VGGDENYRITELLHARKLDGWLTPNVRLEMPTDVKRYNAMLPTKLCPYLGAKFPPQYTFKKSHWKFVEDTLPSTNCSFK
jgi:hypothetical protein